MLGLEKQVERERGVTGDTCSAESGWGGRSRAALRAGGGCKGQRDWGTARVPPGQSEWLSWMGTKGLERREMGWWTGGRWVAGLRGKEAPVWRISVDMV